MTRLTKRLVLFEFSAKRFGEQVPPQIMKTTFTILGASLILAGASVCRGAIYWDGSQTSANSGLPAGISSAAFTDPTPNQSGTPVVLINSSSASDYTGASAGNNFETKAKIGALSTSTSTYFSVALTATAGYAITLNSISLGSRSTPTGPTALTFYSSIDNYATAIGSTTVAASSAWAFISTINFSGSSLTASAGSDVTFRIYGSGGSGTVSGANWRIDDISLDVTAVPETAAWGLISAIGLLGICSVRTWREQRAAKRATLA